MAESKGFLPKWLQDGFVNLISPFIRLFIRLNINPNTFTVWGLLITTAGTAALMWDIRLIHVTGVLILIGGICDIIDGKLARASGRVTKFGALFDSAIDRYSEVIMFFGISAYYVRLDNYLLSVISFIALGGSTMVSYVRARAEGLGLEAKVGLMQRPERIVFIGAGALFNYPLFKISIFHVSDYAVMPLDLAVWLVAVFANFTAIQRLVFVYRNVKGN